MAFATVPQPKAVANDQLFLISVDWYPLVFQKNVGRGVPPLRVIFFRTRKPPT